jgi:hypothetical protein
MDEVSPAGSSSIESGMTLGYGYAEKHQDDRLSLGQIARARSARAVITHVDPTEISASGVDNPVAFWSGFAHGVQRYLLEEAHAPGSREPPTGRS